MLFTKDRMCSLVGAAVFISFLAVTTAQHSNFFEHKVTNLIWCTTSQEEQYKCQNFTVAVERDRAIFDNVFYNISCRQGFDTDECIQLIDTEKAHIMSLDAGEVFLAGRYHSLIPFMQETYQGGFNYFYSVAVVKKGSLPEVTSLNQLRGKKACFAGVGTLAGWTIPIHKLQKYGDMEIIDCNNLVKNAINYFGPSCAINSLLNRNNPIGDNSDKLCSICTGKVPGGKCTSIDPYAGYEGAFRCLLEAGDIAFLKHMTVEEMTKSRVFGSAGTADNFELLCTDGRRMPVSEYRQCNWGNVPSDALVISSAKSSDERRKLQEFLTKAVDLYAHKSPDALNSTSNDNNRNGFGNANDNSRYNSGRGFDDRSGYQNRFGSSSSTTERGIYNNYGTDQASNETQLYEKFDLFESRRYQGRLNLMFEDSAHRLVSIKEDDQLYKNYLGDTHDIISNILQCPVGRMTLCVTSDAEHDKCIKMRQALKAQLINPELLCYRAHSHINCMQAIRGGTADVSVFDVSDVYTAGLKYDLIPFISEVYNLGKPEYYVVAVAKEQDPDTEITYLKGKNTCHGGINTAAGWVYPMAYLISNGWIRPYGCDSVRAAAEYFSKSCIPGALSNEYNTGIPYDNMCDLCHGASYRYCRRDASEDYYGHSGALKCLVEGGGHVAFVKHTTVSENTGGKRKEWWARNTLDFDFELLCPDGTRGYLRDYERCNLGKVKANAIVTRGGESYNETQINAYINLLVYAQQFYGSKDQDDFSFSMYYSLPPYHDLIFQDATRRLQVIEPAERRWDLYVGSDFLRARRITDCFSAAPTINFSIISTLIMVLASLYL